MAATKRQRLDTVDTARAKLNAYRVFEQGRGLHAWVVDRGGADGKRYITPPNDGDLVIACLQSVSSAVEALTAAKYIRNARAYYEPATLTLRITKTDKGLAELGLKKGQELRSDRFDNDGPIGSPRAWIKVGEIKVSLDCDQFEMVEDAEPQEASIEETFAKLPPLEERQVSIEEARAKGEAIKQLFCVASGVALEDISSTILDCGSILVSGGARGASLQVSGTMTPGSEIIINGKRLPADASPEQIDEAMREALAPVRAAMAANLPPVEQVILKACGIDGAANLSDDEPTCFLGCELAEIARYYGAAGFTLVETRKAFDTLGLSYYDDWALADQHAKGVAGDGSIPVFMKEEAKRLKLAAEGKQPRSKKGK